MRSIAIPEAALAALKGRTVLCGFSGGADSSALLLLLHELSEKGLLNLEAVHFDHGLRGEESDADAKWCEAFCKSLGIPFSCLTLEVPSKAMPGEGVEAAARRLRLEAWSKLAAGRDKAAVALGHNAGDRVENLLLRLFRGSNSTGLSSMRLTQEIDGVLFVRPLLETPRKEIEAYLKSSGSGVWREDSSNAGSLYKRNFLRNELLPRIDAEMPYALDGARHSLKALADDASFIEESAVACWRRLSKIERIPAAEWLSLHPALRIRVLRLWLSKETGSDFIPDSKLFERFNAELEREGLSLERRLIPLKDSGSLFIALDREGTSLASNAETPSEPVLWSWRETPSLRWGRLELEASVVDAAEASARSDKDSAYFDLDRLPETLLLRQWAEGERMRPFGRKGEVKLKELFNKAQVPSAARALLPVLRLPDGEPLWIPGVKRSASATLSPDAAKAALFSVKKRL